MTEQPSSQSGRPSIDPAIVEAVHTVANRFGAPGLEELIVEAQRELDEARAALEQLDPGTP